MRGLKTWLCAASLLGGCGDDGRGAQDDLINDDIPPGGPTSTTTSGGEEETTAGSEDECGSSAECGNGLCVAPFVGDDREAFACVNECVELMDESRWCADAAACCDAGATCSSRGYCVIDSGGSGSGTETTGG